MRIHKSVLIYLAYLFISCLFFWRVIFLGEVLFFGDTSLHRVPAMTYWKESVLEGSIPLWNPYIFAGVPLMADLSNNVLSPFNLIYLVMPNPYQALSYLVVLLVSIAAFGVYKYLMLLNFVTEQAAFLGGLVFAFSGTTIAMANDVNALQGIALIPWVMWGGQLLIIHSKTPNFAKATLDKKIYYLRNICILVLLLFFQFVSSHPQYSYYTWILLAAYFFVFLKLEPLNFLKKIQQKLLTKLEKLPFVHSVIKRQRTVILIVVQKLSFIGLIFTLFFGLSAVQLLPFLELSSQTYRPNNAAFSSANSLELLDLPRLVIGHIYGSWAEGNSWGPKAPLEVGRGNSEGFLGIVSLILASYTVFVYGRKISKKSLLEDTQTRIVVFFGIVTIGSLLLALGKVTPLHLLAQKLLPLFSKFRSPIRILAVYSFSLSVLASIGLSLITKQKKKGSW